MSFDIVEYAPRIKRVGVYDIHQLIGKGKFGEVYLAKKDDHPFPIVVKMIPSTHPTIQQFKWQKIVSDEITILKFFSQSKHIVNYISDFHTKNSHYIACEYLGGGDLSHILKREHHFKENVARRIIFQLLNALVEMHSHARRVVHRDIKPANIMFDKVVDFSEENDDVLIEHINVKVCDFGLAKCMLTQELIPTDLLETKAGTPLYMSLERITGDTYDIDVDIWALGVMSYQLLFGVFPFRARSEHELATSLKIFAQTREIDFNVNGVTISDDCKAFLLKILEPAPTKRPYASELVALKWFARERGERVINTGVTSSQTPLQRKMSYEEIYSSVFSSNRQSPRVISNTNVNVFDGWLTMYLLLPTERLSGRTALLVGWTDANTCDDHTVDCLRALETISSFSTLEDELCTAVIKLYAFESLASSADASACTTTLKRASEIISLVGDVSHTYITTRFFNLVKTRIRSAFNSRNIYECTCALYLLESLMRTLSINELEKNSHITLAHTTICSILGSI
jgi:serine/threonine protein kinase